MEEKKFIYVEEMRDLQIRAKKEAMPCWYFKDCIIGMAKDSGGNVAGACRTFAYFLERKLCDLGIENYLLAVLGQNGDTTNHVCNLCKIGKNWFIIDSMLDPRMYETIENSDFKSGMGVPIEKYKEIGVRHFTRTPEKVFLAVECGKESDVFGQVKAVNLDFFLKVHQQ